VLACSTDLAHAVIAGSKALDAAYEDAKKAKRQVDAGDAAKTRREARRRRMKQSDEPGVTPEVTRDKAYKRQAGEALRLAHENELAPMNPKVGIGAAKSEITETHVEAAREDPRAGGWFRGGSEAAGAGPADPTGERMCARRRTSSSSTCRPYNRRDRPVREGTRLRENSASAPAAAGQRGPIALQ
jgi:hypothetical protein